MYIYELTLEEFINEFPTFRIPHYIDRKDPFYRVRFTADLTKFEFGYPSDNWELRLEDNKA